MQSNMILRGGGCCGGKKIHTGTGENIRKGERKNRELLLNSIKLLKNASYYIKVLKIFARGGCYENIFFHRYLQSYLSRSRLQIYKNELEEKEEQLEVLQETINQLKQPKK